MNEKKRNYATELDLLTEKFDADIVNELKMAVGKIKEFYQITDDDLTELLDVDKSYLNNLLNDNMKTFNVDLRFMSLLTLLSNGRLTVLTDVPSGELYNKVNRVMKDFHDERYPEPPKTDINDKILSILNLFGVKNEDDLEHLYNAVKEVRGAINEYDKTHKDNEKKDINPSNCHCSKKECNQNNTTKYVDENGNFQDCNKKECDNAKVKGSYYDSNKMNKPEEFEFTGSFDKLIPNFVNFLNKIL